MDDFEESAFCPTCGAPRPLQRSPEWLLSHFSGMFANILAFLIRCRRERRSASKRELMDAAYIDREDGPPITAPSTVPVVINRHRPELNRLGWDLVGPRITQGGYHLVPLEPNR